MRQYDAVALGGPALNSCRVFFCNLASRADCVIRPGCRTRGSNNLEALCVFCALVLPHSFLVQAGLQAVMTPKAVRGSRVKLGMQNRRLSHFPSRGGASRSGSNGSTGGQATTRPKGDQEPTESNHTVMDKTKHNRHNIAKDERQALRSLSEATDFVIKEVDKGGNVMIMNSLDYNKEIARQLADDTAYKKLLHNPLKDTNVTM
ncbi:hypothetical protein NDU88_009922 [Pleurodeles waltl]|uniref:Uncharacterized protein n=1 Tax=Pleurodeles waltl TaxID=8319 RepID=A0AAV7RZS2_PLEWA|nr:hypothetical protein NDU88_009922 [Pleurodeles waltl]